MPYLSDERKKLIDSKPDFPLLDAGSLTYALYRNAIDTLDGADFTFTNIQHHVDRYMSGKEVKYETFAIVLGCLRSAELELCRQQDKHLHADVIDVCDIIEGFTDKYYREVVGPYEDKKIEENGDVLCD